MNHTKNDFLGGKAKLGKGLGKQAQDSIMLKKVLIFLKNFDVYSASYVLKALIGFFGCWRFSITHIFRKSKFEHFN